MNPRYVIHEEIDRYLNDQMGAAERRLFEEQLASNASVRAEFEAQQIAHQVIIENSLLDLKKQMQRDMNGGSTPPSSGTGRHYRNWLIGLGSLLCVSSLYYFYSNSTDKTTVVPVKESVASQQAPAKEENTPVIITPENHSAGSLVQTPVEKNSTQSVLPPAPTEQTAPVAGDPAGSGNSYSVPTYIAAEKEKPKEEKIEKQNTQAATTPAKPADQTSTTPVNNDPPEATADPKSYTFQPDVEGNWMLPYKENTKGTFRVISRSGVTVYQTSFSSGTTEWNGNDASGTPLPGGYYIYLIEYEQGKAEKGSLTILR